MASIVEKILDRLQIIDEETGALLEIIAAGKHGYFRKAAEYQRYGPTRSYPRWSERYRAYKRFHNALYYLKKEGFVEGKKVAGKHTTLWRLTKGGIERLLRIKKRKNNPLSLGDIQYEKRSQPSLTIVIFDVPEREKMKRTWLRGCLKYLGFSLLQKSVWIGKAKLPIRFLRDLHKNKLIPYIHIFAVNRRGTIRELS